VAIKPFGKGLLMETLRYADEVKKADTAFDGVPAKGVDKDLVELAQELIEKKAAPFHPEKFKDTYTTALREVIEAKLEKRPPKQIEEAPPASNVINLMDALKRSVGKGGKEAARGNGKGAEKERGKTRSKASRAKTTRRKAAKRKAA
jgi:DNA end-binding protein Ku